MSVPDSRDNATESNEGSDRFPSRPPYLEVHEDDHSLNESWKWPDEFTEFVEEHMTGVSIAIGTGLRPICDVNVDIANLVDIADSPAANFDVEPLSKHREEAEWARGLLADGYSPDHVYAKVVGKQGSKRGRYDGVAVFGDLFELPLAPSVADTVVVDPPWIELDKNDREAIFSECLRVLRPGGVILYNATWLQDYEQATHLDTRPRQDHQFAGNSSFVSFYQRDIEENDELMEAYGIQLADEQSSKRVGAPPYTRHVHSVSSEHGTDARIVYPNKRDHCCPMCGCSRLDQLQDEFFESERQVTDKPEEDRTRYTLYRCSDCGFRPEAKTVRRLAAHLKGAAEEQNVKLSELEEITYTPPCVRDELERAYRRDRDLPRVSPDLPWVPQNMYLAATGQCEEEFPDGFGIERAAEVLKST